MESSTAAEFRSWRDALDHPLFRGVDEARVASVLREAAPRLVPAGTLLNTPGLSNGRLHLVLAGRLMSYRLTANGHQLLLEIVEPGAIDGLLQVGGQPSHFTEALADSTVLSLSRPQLRRLSELEPRIEDNLVGLAAAKLAEREEHMESMASRGIPALARLLLGLGHRLGRRSGTRIVLEPRLTHQMLADMLGVRRETVTMQFAELSRMGRVTVSKGHILLDPRALESIAEPETEFAAVAG